MGKGPGGLCTERQPHSRGPRPQEGAPSLQAHRHPTPRIFLVGRCHGGAARPTTSSYPPNPGVPERQLQANSHLIWEMERVLSGQ